ncbi:hypothetical protein F4809DRAFT_166226 [Biscogniauxia mediterranea]|nr:hypothetical protein F4809DRAFT_166226 [Biscogniauxia mediterranea]
MAWTLIKWGLPRWLVVLRIFQVLAEFVSATMNGFLLAYIQVNKLAYSNSLFALELMACAALIYSSLVLLIQHTGRRRHNSSTTMIGTFLVLDVLLIGMLIAMITVLANAGVPSNCHGMTRDNIRGGDAPDQPSPGYSTIRFGDGKDKKGELDRYCAIERGFFDITLILVFTYIATITLGALRVAERHYTGGGSTDSRIKEEEEERYQLDYMQSEFHRQGSTTSPRNMGVPTQGVIAPVSSRNSPAARSQDTISSISNYQSLDAQQRQTSHPVSPVSPVSPLTPMNRTFNASPTPEPPSPMGGLMITHATDEAAEATITDGYRHQMQSGMHSLPPYSPGPSRGLFMMGHGDESNDMRLSDYVKGETRAQNMKDGGAGM